MQSETLSHPPSPSPLPVQIPFVIACHGAGLQVKGLPDRMPPQLLQYSQVAISNIKVLHGVFNKNYIWSALFVICGRLKKFSQNNSISANLEHYHHLHAMKWYSIIHISQKLPEAIALPCTHPKPITFNSVLVHSLNPAALREWVIFIMVFTNESFRNNQARYELSEVSIPSNLWRDSRQSADCSP